MSRILIVDDDSQFRRMLKQTLQRNGYEVIDAEDGNAGIKMYKEKGADLVITDLVMPEKEGLETIQELRDEFQDINIIAISGGSRINHGQYLKSAELIGANKVFPKPYERDKLLEAIRELLNKQKT